MYTCLIWSLSSNERSTHEIGCYCLYVCVGHFTHNWMQLSSGVSHFKELPVWLSQSRQLADETYFGALTHNAKHTHKDKFGASEEISEQSDKGSWVKTTKEVHTSLVLSTTYTYDTWPSFWTLTQLWNKNLSLFVSSRHIKTFFLHSVAFSNLSIWYLDVILNINSLGTLLGQSNQK